MSYDNISTASHVAVREREVESDNQDLIWSKSGAAD